MPGVAPGFEPTTPIEDVPRPAIAPRFLWPRPARPLAPLPIGISLSPYLLNGTIDPRDYEERPANWPIDTIVLHHTSLPSRLSPGQIAASWQNDLAEVSAHFVVGAAGEIMMTIPPSRTAFHILKQAAYPDPETGRPVNWINTRSIGIEVNYDPRYERPSPSQIMATGRLIGALFEVYPSLDLRRLMGHGVQSFADGTRGRALSEPTYLFLQPDGEVDRNFLLLLTSAATVSERIAQAIDQAGGVAQMAEQIRRQTIAGCQLSRRLNSNWKRDSGMPSWPIDPNQAIGEAQAIADVLARPRGRSRFNPEVDRPTRRWPHRHSFHNVGGNVGGLSARPNQ